MQSSNRFAHLRYATGSLGQEAFHLSKKKKMKAQRLFD